MLLSAVSWPSSHDIGWISSGSDCHQMPEPCRNNFPDPASVFKNILCKAPSLRQISSQNAGTCRNHAGMPGMCPRRKQQQTPRIPASPSNSCRIISPFVGAVPRCAAIMPRSAGTISNILPLFLKKGPISSTGRIPGSFVACRNVPQSCRDGKPPRKKQQDSRAIR